MSTVIIIIIALVVIGIIINLISAIADFFSEYGSTILCGLGAIGVIALYIYGIFAEEIHPVLAVILALIGVALVGFSIYLFVVFIQNIKHNSMLRKQSKAKLKFNKHGEKILSAFSNSFNEQQFVNTCMQDNKMRKYAQIAFYPEYKDTFKFWADKLETVYCVTAKDMICSFILDSLMEIPAFTFDEVLTMCRNNKKLSGFSKLKDYVENVLVSLVKEQKLEKKPMGNNQYLYSNISGVGAVMKSTIIEM